MGVPSNFLLHPHPVSHILKPDPEELLLSRLSTPSPPHSPHPAPHPLLTPPHPAPPQPDLPPATLPRNTGRKAHRLVRLNSDSEPNALCDLPHADILEGICEDSQCLNSTRACYQNLDETGDSKHNVFDYIDLLDFTFNSTVRSSRPCSVALIGTEASFFYVTHTHGPLQNLLTDFFCRQFYPVKYNK